MKRATAAVAALTLLVACSGDDDTATTTTPPGSVAEPVETPPTSSGSVATPATTPGTAGSVVEPVETSAPVSTDAPAAPTTAPGPLPAPTAALELAGEFDRPVDLAVLPGNAALYVVEQDGRVVRAEGDAHITVLDLSDRVSDGNEQGLLGLAFDPESGRAFVNYTESVGDTIVTSFAIAGDGTFDLASEQVIITIDQPYANHNGGGVVFGPDGHLYIGMGDGGSANDPERRAQDPFDLLGKLLRIDPLPASGEPYAIPADNPFVDGAAGAPEVWSLGLRNPWRFGFGPAGELWIADVGQNEIEEINMVAVTDRPAGAGANFGWSAFEGTARFNDDVPATPDMIPPVFEYTHAEGCSISGGAVVGGWYVYGDYCSGILWAFDPATGRNEVLAESVGQITTVRPGPDGATYVLLHNGPILRL